MIIPLKFPDASDTHSLPPTLAKLGSEEVVLIELQGFLESEGDTDGELVGTLCLDNPDKPTLTIGHHLLEGKLANLPKPFAVLARNAPPLSAHAQAILGSLTVPDHALSSSPLKPPAPPKTEDDMDLEQADADNGSFDVVALVKRKIVFSKRPIPIVGNASATGAGVDIKS